MIDEREPPPGDEPEWLSVAEAGRATGYAHDYLYELKRKGRLVTRERSWGIEVHMPSLRAYMEQSGFGPRSTDEDEG